MAARWVLPQIRNPGWTIEFSAHTQDADKDASPEFLDQMERLGQEYEESYVAGIVDMMERYEKPVIGVSLARTDEGTVRPVAGGRYNGVFYQAPENAVNVLSRMVAYRRFLENQF